jgi:Subtilase family
MPFTTGLAAAVTVLGVLGSPSAMAAPGGAARTSVRSQEWWLASLHVKAAWQTSVGAGITVAVLSTGVDLGTADLAGDVTTGPDFSGSGRTPGSPFWGYDGTVVASIIAGHGHGAGDRSGIIGIAPAARILSVRVTLEFNDPLSADASISRRLPQAIAAGITYAVAHGARIIDLPLDPGTLGMTGQSNPAAIGGSPAERAAVAYALNKNVVLIAPAGDDGMGPGLVNYPAAYPGVIAVGAVSRGGRLASFSSRRSYVSLTAPGVGLEVPDLADGYQMTSSTSAASGMVAGVAALILSRFPDLSVTQVREALTDSTAPGPAGAGLPALPARSPDGTGYGTIDAARAIEMATLITAARQPAAPPARPHKPAPRPVAASHRPGASAAARSVLLAALAGVGALIVLLVATILIMRSRRGRMRGAPTGHTRARGLHEQQRRPEGGPVAPAPDQGRGVRGQPQRMRPSPPPADTWPSPGGWQGGGLGEIDRSAAPPFRPAMTSAPRAEPGYRSGHGAEADGKAGGPPWAPAPEPGHTASPLPVASPISPPRVPRPGIRVPGDMAVPTTGTGEPAPPSGLYTPTPPEGFPAIPLPPDFAPVPPADFGPTPLLPDFGPGTRASDFAPVPPAADFGPAPLLPDFGPGTRASDFGPPQASAFPAREHLGFAAAPVAADYPAAFPDEQADEGAPAAAADPSYIWDLAATDVFPAATGGGGPAETGAPTQTDAPPPEGGSGDGANLRPVRGLRRRRAPSLSPVRARARVSPARARARARAPGGRR